MKDVSSDIHVKATIAAIVIYAIAMGLIGDYWAVQCGLHWFTYSVLSYLPFAVPGVVVMYFVLLWVFSHYTFGQLGQWMFAGVVAVLFFVGCFVFGHLQPAMPLYNGNDCQLF